MTQVIPLGYPITMVQDTVYALPARAGRIQSTLILQISPDGSTWDDLTNSETVGADCASGFVRAHTGAPVAVFKPY
jgi:hypothetical protein